MYLYAADCVERQDTPFFGEMRAGYATPSRHSK
jgi:hypothetical protein